MDNNTFQLQTRFSYWIVLFESQFGDLLGFWEAMGDISSSAKLIEINNLLLEIIKKSGAEAIVPKTEPVIG